MLNGATPVIFSLRDLASAGGAPLGHGPFVPSRPIPLDTPFGVTDADSKAGPPLQPPLSLFALTRGPLLRRFYRLPLPGDTPFGVTDSDIKGPGEPLPLLFTPTYGLQHQRLPSHRGFVQPQVTTLKITGVSRDNTGAVLAGCVCALYRTSDDAMVERVTSDSNGNYSFSAIGLSEQYYIVAYKAGTPVRGTTDNTLVGVRG